MSLITVSSDIASDFNALTVQNNDFPPIWTPERCEALQARCKVLEQELEQRTSELLTARTEAETAKVNLASIKAYNNEIKAELQRQSRDHEQEKAIMQEELDAKDFNTAESRKECKALQSRNQELEKQELVHKLSTPIQQKSQPQDPTSAITRQAAIISQLQAQVAELERERALKQPIFTIGLAIRIRNLELAKRTLFDLSQNRYLKVDNSLVQAGNVAAHNANGLVDKTIFQLPSNILSEEKKNDLELVFEKLHGSLPGGYGALPGNLLEAMDCDATIRSLAVVNAGFRPLVARQQASDRIEYIKEKYGKLSKEAFEESGDVEQKLKELRAFTEEIVRADRVRGVDKTGDGRRSSECKDRLCLGSVDIADGE